MANDVFRLEQDGALAVITLDRPEELNAFDLALADGLLEAAIACDEDPTVRAIMIVGNGKAFCAGGDIRAMLEHADDEGNAGAYIKRLTVSLHAAIATLARTDKPVVTAVNGTAAGAGFSLAVAGDLVLASEEAKLTLAYTRIGLAPDGSSTYSLPRLVGTKRAFELIAGNRVLSAAEAKDWGLVNEVFPAANFRDEARAYCKGLSEGPTRALAAAKKLLLLGANESLETQMEHERRAIAECADSEDFKEGAKAFFEKRPASYVGR